MSSVINWGVAPLGATGTWQQCHLPDITYMSSLMEAASVGHVAVVESLVALGASGSAGDAADGSVELADAGSGGRAGAACGGCN